MASRKKSAAAATTTLVNVVPETTSRSLIGKSQVDVIGRLPLKSEFAQLVRQHREKGLTLSDKDYTQENCSNWFQQVRHSLTLPLLCSQ